MRFYLHIGTEKTGTTTLQHFLDSNRSTLNELGYLYTRSAGVANNRKLSVAVYNLDRRDDFTNLENIYSKEALSEYQKSVIKNLKQEIQESLSSEVIFSSEHIQSRLTDVSEIQNLKEALNYLGATDIKVIIYLRDPAEIANSLYSTAIKAGSAYEHPPSPAKNKYYWNVCNHKHTLQRFSDVFGKTSLIPRIFDKKELKNNSILEDFIDVIGAPWIEGYSIPDNMNESLSATGLAILRRLNNKIPRFINSKVNPLRGDLVHYFSSHYSGEKYSMPFELYQEYEEAFQESNEWVRQNWFPERDTLFLKKRYPQETKPRIPEDELDTIASMLADVWINKQEKIVSFQKQLKKFQG